MMTIQQFVDHLSTCKELIFTLPNNETVPLHFHVTEVGSVEKNYIDCGMTIRKERKASMQLWVADDTAHRLHADKLIAIIQQSNKLFDLDALEIEIEYQANSISKYALSYNGSSFQLMAMQTNCLAPDQCGIPTQKTKKPLADLPIINNVCEPGSGCC